MKPWKRIEPTIKHKLGYKNLVTKIFVLPDGQVQEYTTVNSEHSHCIATIALTPDNQVIVARQFRVGPQKVLDELPGGGVEEHDDGYELAARRELQEETGYTAKTMEFLGDVYKDAYTNTTWHFYLATGCTLHKDGQRLDETEHIEVHLISINQLLDNAKNARMTDTEAVLLAYDHLQARLAT